MKFDRFLPVIFLITLPAFAGSNAAANPALRAAVSPRSASISGAGVTTDVNRIVSLPADEAQVFVTAFAGLDSTVDVVVAALQSAGIGAKDLVGQGVTAYGGFGGTAGDSSVMEYDFQMTVPAAKMQDLANKLEALRQNPPAKIFDLSFVTNLSVSAKHWRMRVRRPCPICWPKPGVKPMCWRRPLGLPWTS